MVAMTNSNVHPINPATDLWPQPAADRLADTLTEAAEHAARAAMIARHPSSEHTTPHQLAPYGSLPIRTTPATTLHLNRLDVTAEVLAGADQIGLHVSSTDNAHREYLTVTPTNGEPIVMLRLPGYSATIPPARMTVLDLVLKACDDDLSGDFRLSVVPDLADGESGWRITGAIYTDAEGQSWAA